MTPGDLIAAFPAVAEAPDGVARLREFVLQLAVRGKLVPQDLSDEPASVLLERIAAEKARRVKAGSSRRRELLSPVSRTDVPFELADGWRWARFTDVARIASNLVDPAEFRSEPHVAPDNIEKTTGRLFGYRTIGEDGVTSGKHRFSPGQILYSKIRPNLSKVVIVDFGGLCSADMYPIDPWIDRGYLHRFMLSQPFLDQITSDDNRLAMPKINQEQLAAVQIPVPPLAEQHRIVARVDELMCLLEQLEAARTSRDATRAAARDSVLDALREADTTDEVEVAWNRFAERMDQLLCDPADIAPLRQTVLQLAVRGKLVPQDLSDEPASVLLERIAAEKARLVNGESKRKREPLPPVAEKDVPFEVADGWCWARFTDVARIASNLVDPAEFRSEPHVAADNIEKATGRLLGYRTIGEDGVTSGKHRFSPGQILYSKIRPNLSKVVTVDFGGLCSADMYPIDPWINRAYLHRFMLSQPFLDQIKSDDNRLAMPKVNQEQLSAIYVPIAPLAEQQRIVARVNELMGLLDRLEGRLAAERTSHAAFAAAAVHQLAECSA